MRDFSYSRAETLDAARAAAARSGAMLIAGGTTLLDLAKCGVAAPETVIDITRLPGLADISVGADGARIGALATMADAAGHASLRAAFPAAVEALDLAASAQIRNMASVGGNLLQRTRCAYFRDPAAYPACNKRRPGSGCAAIGGVTRNHAVLGVSDHCIALYPGDFAVALVALGATVHLGDRSVPVEDFFLEPGPTPDRETVLAPGELITAISLPASKAAAHSTYLKVRDRQSYEFASASAAVALDLHEDGRTVREIRVALGGVATKPWRAREVEDALRGRPLTEAVVRAAAELAMIGALAQGGNAYKIDLAPRVVARAILKVGGLA
ncbi:FAD binding domain-containing protein [Aureimonas pseudogalii]|uniref:Xanthine dehydrogenase YagS FAD-binding subunit n=1 Tax=Aureimonas pseudogalii TaxID=1744844 RepID=A0A7W6E815_9HYPH|nr:xanthine dehydrogenase family protein subunit M [Aureimonas pseudogalii]MBB3996457.1 xanthine dehydrogenase YagS FAD-binding subunit [Aureimonas pseudogalii]